MPVNFILKYIYKYSVANGGIQVGGVVILNVGGKIHQVKWETIDKFPKSRLQKLRYATSQGMIDVLIHKTRMYDLS